MLYFFMTSGFGFGHLGSQIALAARTSLRARIMPSSAFREVLGRYTEALEGPLT